MSEKQIFSRTTLSPTEVAAGDSTEFIIRLVVGPDYPDQPTRIVFDCQDMLGTSCPNARMNEEPGYVEAYVSNPDVTYAKSFLKCGAYELGAECYADGSSNTPLEGQRMIQLDLSAGLTAGDVIEVHWGETLGGFGPGTRVTHVVPRPDFRAWIDVREKPSQSTSPP